MRTEEKSGMDEDDQTAREYWEEMKRLAEEKLRKLGEKEDESHGS